MDNTTNPHPVPTPPLRKRSLHRLSSQLRIGSSEVSPSDHSSVFDAVPYSHSSRLSSGYLSDTDDEDGSSLAKDSLQSILSTYASPNLTNRSAGTKLFTISEQKSVPTLKTVPSNWTFQRRIVTTPPQISHNVAEARQSRAGHRRCFSVDENALQHHRGSEVSTTASLTSDSVMQSGDRPAPLRIPIRPVQPPFKPPERAQTPAGFPRWPGERDYRPNAVRQMVRPSQMSFRESFNEYLYSSPAQGLRLRDVLRGQRRILLDTPTRTGARFWRPPASAHSTRRFEGVESHPFGAAPAKGQNRRTAHDGEDPRYGEVSLPTAQASQFQGSSVRPALHNDRTVAHNGPDELTASQRALRHASGNAVIVSPHRASTRASIRSIHVPIRVRNASHAVIAEAELSQIESTPGTIRTIDIVNSFPEPPGHFHEHQRSDEGPRICRPMSWSLFPKEKKPDDGNTIKSFGRKLQKNNRPQAPPENSPPTVVQGAALSNGTMREESSARYRDSGTAMYDECRPPLASPSLRQDRSSDSGIQALGTRVLHTLSRSETQRALSNGALRFSSLRQASVQHSTSSAHPKPNQNSTLDHSTHTAAASPKTERPCKHKPAKVPMNKTPLRSITNQRPIHFDGTSPPAPHIPPEPTITTQDYALPHPAAALNPADISNRNSSVPVIGMDPSSPASPTTTFTNAHPNGLTTFHSPPLNHSSTGHTNHTNHTHTPSVSATLPGRA